MIKKRNICCEFQVISDNDQVLTVSILGYAIINHKQFTYQYLTLYPYSNIADEVKILRTEWRENARIIIALDEGERVSGVIIEYVFQNNEELIKEFFDNLNRAYQDFCNAYIEITEVEREAERAAERDRQIAEYEAEILRDARNY